MPTFDHVAQQVVDVAAAVQWVRDNLPGCEVLYEDESWALLRAGGVKMAFVSRGHHPDHVAWRVSEEELRDLAQRFGKQTKRHRDQSQGFYLEAPGGASYEFIAYPAGYPHI